MSGPASMVRREKAAEKAKRRKVDRIEYRVEEGDLLIMSGQYKGMRASQLFAQGAAERDFVIKNLWFDHDEAAMAVIRTFLCK